jgi:hypothetical protein
MPPNRQLAWTVVSALSKRASRRSSSTPPYMANAW